MRIFAAMKASLVYYKILVKSNSLIAQNNLITHEIYGKD